VNADEVLKLYLEPVWLRLWKGGKAWPVSIDLSVGAPRKPILAVRRFFDMTGFLSIRASIVQTLSSFPGPLQNLAPDIQAEILFLPKTMRGRDPLSAREVLKLGAIEDWGKQRKRWRKLQA